MIHFNFWSDDLGTQYFTYSNCSIATAVNYCLANKGEGYNIVKITVKKKWWIFGSLTIELVCEDPNKIRALENSQHYAVPLADPKTVIDKKTFDRLVDWLCGEYEVEEATRSLKKAKFYWESKKHLNITYTTGHVDKLLIDDNQLVHLNPYKYK